MASLQQSHRELDFNNDSGFGAAVTLASSFEGEELDLDSFPLIINLVARMGELL